MPITYKPKYIVKAAMIVVNVGTTHEKYLNRNAVVSFDEVSATEIGRLLRNDLIVDANDTAAVAYVKRLDEEENGPDIG